MLDALVAGYEPLIPALTLPDPDDRHVLAAAVVCRASCIVTFDLAHFPQECLAPYGLHAIHPDEFLLDIQSIDPVGFARAVAEDVRHYRAPPVSLADYTASLAKAGVPRLAAQITGPTP